MSPFTTIVCSPLGVVRGTGRWPSGWWQQQQPFPATAQPCTPANRKRAGSKQANNAAVKLWLNNWWKKSDEFGIFMQCARYTARMIGGYCRYSDRPTSAGKNPRALPVSSCSGTLVVNEVESFFFKKRKNMMEPVARMCQPTWHTVPAENQRCIVAVKSCRLCL